MLTNEILYLAETVITIIAVISGLIYYELKHKKRFLKFLAFLMSVFIALIGVTFVLEKPKMQTEDIYYVEVNTQGTINKPHTIYHFTDVTEKVQVVGNVNTSKIGLYTISFQLETLRGLYTEEANIRVVDTKKPEIILEGLEEHRQSYKKEYEEPGYKAIDDYEGNLTDKVKVTKQNIDETNFNLKYEVQDSSGNKAERTRKVTIIDDVPPEITINGQAEMSIYLNEKYTENGAKAIDEKDGDLTDKITIEGKVDTGKEGTYTITYNVTDNSGNKASKFRNVVVKKKEAVAQNTAPIQNTSSGQKGTIYLTFDDGPSTNITPKVLDILKEKNVKATFFILNYGSAGESLVKREYAEGHTIGIHGYSHDYHTIYQSEDAYMSNITKLQEKIKASTGYNAKITRFPGGSSNTVSSYNPGIMSRLTKLVLSKGYKYFDWNVSSGDAGGVSSSEQLYQNVIKGISKSKQNVVLMHDFSSNTKLLDALGRIIDYGKQNGYTFSKITESTPMVTHHINN